MLKKIVTYLICLLFTINSIAVEAPKEAASTELKALPAQEVDSDLEETIAETISFQINICQEEKGRFLKGVIKVNEKESINCDEVFMLYMELLEAQQANDPNSTFDRENFFSCATDKWSLEDQLSLARLLDLDLSKTFKAECEKNDKPLVSCLEGYACSLFSANVKAANYISKLFSDKKALCKDSTTDSGCLGEIFYGIFKNLASNIEGIWEGIKWVGSSIWGSDDEDETLSVTAVENATSETMIVASAQPDGFFKKLMSSDDKFGVLTESLSNLWKGVGDIIESGTYENFGCAKWADEGSRYNELGQKPKCLEPVISFGCASCEQQMNMVCGVAGFLGGEVIMALLTGGAANAIGKAGKAAAATKLGVLTGRAISKIGNSKIVAKLGKAGASVLRDGKKLSFMIGGKVQQLKPEMLTKILNSKAVDLGKKAVVLPGKVALSAADKVLTYTGAKWYLRKLDEAFVRGYAGKEAVHALRFARLNELAEPKAKQFLELQAQMQEYKKAGQAIPEKQIAEFNKLKNDLTKLDTKLRLQQSQATPPTPLVAANNNKAPKAAGNLPQSRQNIVVKNNSTTRQEIANASRYTETDKKLSLQLKADKKQALKTVKTDIKATESALKRSDDRLKKLEQDFRYQERMAERIDTPIRPEESLASAVKQARLEKAELQQKAKLLAENKDKIAASMDNSTVITLKPTNSNVDNFQYILRRDEAISSSQRALTRSETSLNKAAKNKEGVLAKEAQLQNRVKDLKLQSTNNLQNIEELNRQKVAQDAMADKIDTPVRAEYKIDPLLEQAKLKQAKLEQDLASAQKAQADAIPGLKAEKAEANRILKNAKNAQAVAAKQAEELAAISHIDDIAPSPITLKVDDATKGIMQVRDRARVTRATVIALAAAKDSAVDESDRTPAEQPDVKEEAKTDEIENTPTEPDEPQEPDNKPADKVLVDTKIASKSDDCKYSIELKREKESSNKCVLAIRDSKKKGTKEEYTQIGKEDKDGKIIINKSDKKDFFVFLRCVPNEADLKDVKNKYDDLFSAPWTAAKNSDNTEVKLLIHQKSNLVSCSTGKETPFKPYVKPPQMQMDQAPQFTPVSAPALIEY